MSFCQYVDFIRLLCDDCRNAFTRGDFSYLFLVEVPGEQLQFFTVLTLTSVSAMLLKRRLRGSSTILKALVKEVYKTLAIQLEGTLTGRSTTGVHELIPVKYDINY